MKKTKKERKFYELTPAERLTRLADETRLPQEQWDALSGAAGLSVPQADHMIENVIGTFSLPLGMAQHFLVNGREVPVPMVIEEPSVVAAASFMAKLARSGGGFTASASAPEMIGQMQVLDVPDLSKAKAALEASRDSLLCEADDVDPLLKKLGGGARGLAATGSRPACAEGV